jgi:beta-N-acetylhexosaminidase
MDQMKKIGQLFVFGFVGPEPDRTILRMIGEFGLGGVILFSRNIREPRQTAELVQWLQSEAKIPLFIGVDQEGGRVSRLTEHFTPFPGNHALGHSGSSELAHAFGRATAEELSAVGINLDFAPVLDINTNPENPVIGKRSFGADPELVSDLGCAVIQGLQEKGIIACGKHFPGHGDTVLDSHLALPRVLHSIERLRLRELIPFKRAIRCGVETLMSAHVLYPELDPQLPATLSPAILHQLLRKELGFRGLLFSDDMEMKAVDDHFVIEESAVLALKAGVDVLLICKDPTRQERALEAVLEAAERGDIPAPRLEEAVNRVLALKKRRFHDPFHPDPARIEKTLRAKEHLRLASTLEGYLKA